MNIGMGNPGVQMWTLGFVFLLKEGRAEKSFVSCAVSGPKIF